MSDLNPLDVTSWDCCDEHETTYLRDSYCKDCRIEELEAQVRKDFDVICSLDIEAMGVVPEAHDCPAYPIRDQYLHEMCASMRKIGVELAAIKGGCSDEQ